MAEKKVEKTVEKEAKVTEKQVVAPTGVTSGDAVLEARKRKHTIIWIVVAGGVLLVILVVLLVMTIAHQYVSNYNNGMNGGYSQTAPTLRGRSWNQTQITTSSSSTDGPTTTTTRTTYTLTQGVVTKVEDGSLTVAGNGKAQKITTNSSTTYVGDQKPQANDSVAVWGTTDSNGNITATQVQVLNN